MPGGDPSAVLIVGHGLIGRAVGAMLTARRIPVASVGRRPAELPGYRALDLASEGGRAALRLAIEDLHPRCVLLVHGPSDVTWIDANASAAAAVHCGVAAIAARSGAPVILVSTDNVFPGTRGGYRPEDPVRPPNGYGRVKAQSETLLVERGGVERGGLASAPALVLRVSLVYGWAGPGLRATYAQRCLAAAAAGRAISAPVDQIFTPIHSQDVAAVLAAVCSASASLDGPLAPGQTAVIRHLAGPEELSRYEFARLAYELAGRDPSLVTCCLRRETEWACRPRFSSLACGTFTDVPELREWRPMTPAQGLRAMLAAGPAAAEPASRDASVR
jgi:dTDP-4-dehydrorhamnose reductase